MTQLPATTVENLTDMREPMVFEKPSSNIILRLRMLALAGIVTISALNAQLLPRHAIDVELDFSGREIRTTWVNGYFPRFTKSWNGSKPTVWMLDKNGTTVVPETELAFPEAYFVDVRAVTADSLGNLYASAEVWSRGRDGIGVICKLTPKGDPIRVTRTDEFVTTQMVATRSGEIWGFGLPILMQTKRTTSEDFMTMIRVDGSGRVIGRMIPRSTFGPDIIPVLGYGNVGIPRLWATSTRVGLYVPKPARWIEFDALTAKLLVNAEVPRPAAADGKQAAMIELAMTESENRVYAFFYYPFGQDASHGPGLYGLDRSARRWVLVRDHRASDEFGGLFGADGDDLIMRAGTKTFGWIPAETMRDSK